MRLLTRPRSRSSRSPTTPTPEVEPTPPSAPPSPPSPPPSTPTPRVQGLKFFRTLSTRSLPTSNAEDTKSWETSPRAAARALRGWFGSPPSPSSSKAEEQTEYNSKHLDNGKEWEAFLRSVEDEGGFGVPLPKSPSSLRRVGEENKERRRRSDSKSSDWDAAMLAHARSLGYSCPSSPSNFSSHGSPQSFASGSSGWSSAHTPSMSVFSPSIRAATYYHPMGSRASSYSGGRREPRRSITSEDFVVRYFAGEGPTEGSMLEGSRQERKPKGVRGPIRNEAQSSSEQNALQLVFEARPAEPIFGASPPSPSRSPRDALCPPSPSPPRTRSPDPHRRFRPSPLRPRSPCSVDSEDTKRWEEASTDLETLSIRKGKRRRNTTDDLTTIWETGSHREI